MNLFTDMMNCVCCLQGVDWL